jgi:anti-sigma regulatory factor (Ser/Thr protein kinase)
VTETAQLDRAIPGSRFTAWRLYVPALVESTWALLCGALAASSHTWHSHVWARLALAWLAVAVLIGLAFWAWIQFRYDRWRPGRVAAVIAASTILGLVAAAQKYIESYVRQYSVPVDIDFAGLSRERFRPEVEIALYRILQEALTNIVKHARASQVRVTLKKARGRLALTIADNGVGFDVASLQTAAGNTCLGIHGMRERVALLAGSFAVKSGPGAGTAITAQVPLKEKKENGRAAG